MEVTEDQSPMWTARTHKKAKGTFQTKTINSAQSKTIAKDLHKLSSHRTFAI